MTIRTVTGGINLDPAHVPWLRLTQPLYGVAPPCNNSRKDQDVDRAGAGPQERPRTDVDGSSGGQDIIDQDELAPDHLSLASLGHAKGALHVVAARGFVEANLLGRRFDPLQGIMRNLAAAVRGN